MLQGARRTTRTLHVSLTLVPFIRCKYKIICMVYSKYFSSLDRKWFLDKLKPEGKAL